MADRSVTTKSDDTGKTSPLLRLEAISSLKNRGFFFLWLGTFLSFNGMQMLVIARGWLVYTLTNSPLALGMVAAAMGAPIVLFSIFGGVLADRVQKRNLLMAAQSGLALINLVVAILVSMHLIALWHLVLSSLLTGVIFAFSMPTRQAFVVELVGPAELTNAIALNSLATNICRIGSPALAGVLLRVIGTDGVLWLVALSYGAAMATMFWIPAGSKMPKGRGLRLFKDILDGFRYLRRNAVLLSLLSVAIVPILVATSYQMLMPVFAKTIFQAGETGLGLLMSAGGLGALVGSTLIAALGNVAKRGTFMLGTGLLFGLSQVFFGLSPSLAPAFVCLVFVGGSGSMFMTLITSLIMGHTPRELMGRVMSIFVMTFGLMPLAMLPAGALAKVFGAPLVVALGGGLFAVFLLCMALLMPRLRRLA